MRLDITNVNSCQLQFIHKVKEISTSLKLIDKQCCQKCRYMFFILSDDRVTLTFTHIDIGDPEGQNCTVDYVQVLDGDDAAAPLFGTYCGQSLHLPHTSRGSAIAIRFVTSAANSNRHGFRAVYTTSVSGGFVGVNLCMLLLLQVEVHVL